MAVYQISKIQIRRGKTYGGTGLPQLASGELAWSIDTAELFIGNRLSAVVTEEFFERCAFLINNHSSVFVIYLFLVGHFRFVARQFFSEMFLDDFDQLAHCLKTVSGLLGKHPVEDISKPLRYV